VTDAEGIVYPKAAAQPSAGLRQRDLPSTRQHTLSDAPYLAPALPASSVKEESQVQNQLPLHRKRESPSPGLRQPDPWAAGLTSPMKLGHP
jgi:hypothetical protein